MRVWVTRSEGRKVWLEGVLEGEDGTRFCSGSALYVRPRALEQAAPEERRPKRLASFTAGVPNP